MADNIQITVKLETIFHYKGTIELKTGLHIGGTNTAMTIGGLNKCIVRNPVTGIPYIPGSSLKGKMRSLLELKDSDISREESTVDNKTVYSYGPSKSEFCNVL